MPKIATMCIIIFLAALVLLVYIFFFSKAWRQKPVTWGVDFSQLQAENLHLDWKEVYTAMLQDLGVKNIKLHTLWNVAEAKKQGEYDFSDIDWQVEQAGRYNAKIIYVTGMKTGRWPECHIPGWAESLSKEDQQNAITDYITQAVNRYKGNPVISAWQAENEPLFVFGQCPWYDKEFLKKEVALIKSLDPTRSVIISDSGEQSTWFAAAGIGDIVGITTYRKVWVHITDSIGFYFTFLLSPGSYFAKAQLIENIFHKKVIGIELQAEPWSSVALYDTPLAEQQKTMDVDKFKENIDFAKNTGLDTFYLWGVEWWYWMKTAHNQPAIWNEARKLFTTNA